ncbi:hypothetical protein BT96DRAFT_1019978 [Gymnopus androsaceus JB14]|uniref:Uncharacterized protein n=1 Tax=Gymnopus androsaceus JB14 TaxID=1447944 RepID=A0A6A4HMD0_9AGAR|nr:hypothetical protein BT96DRAFT_1019978 [Gymnopus androsaceus JB14]
MRCYMAPLNFDGALIISELQEIQLVSPTGACHSAGHFLLGTRIYALYGRSVRILSYMLGSGVTLAGVAVTDEKRCKVQYVSDLATAWEALFCYDSILFGFTLYQTHKSRRSSTGMGHLRNPLVSLMLRDGAIYFAVMALANLANIMTFYLTGTRMLQPFLRGGLSTFASVISVSMLSRIFLNLHSSAQTGIFSTVPTFQLEDESLPTGVELDTLRTGDLTHGLTTRYSLDDRPP